MFEIAKILSGRQNVPETLEMPTLGGEKYSVGEALVISSGAVTKAAGDVDVKYISMENYAAPSSGARKLKCFKVLPDQLYIVKTSAFSSSTQKPGLSVTISSDGLGVTATATSSSFGAEIVDTNGAVASGDKIYVVLR